MMTVLDMALRLCLALCIGGLVGWERERSHRPAGLRTHMLVTVGAAVVMLTGQYSAIMYAGMGVAPFDPNRLPAQVISGVGFLGAGTIMKEGSSIKGLTTAASVWSVACLGIAAGAGFYAISILGCLGIIFTLTIIEHLEKKVGSGKRTRLLVSMICLDAGKTLMQINNILHVHGASLQEINMKEHINEEQDQEQFTLSFKLYTNKPRSEVNYTFLSAQICAIPGVSNFEMEEF